MNRIALAALLLLFLATAAQAVQTTVSVVTPVGQPLGNATIQIFSAEGEVVAEEKADEDGVVVFDLPEGNYTAKTIDGAYSAEVKAGEAISFAIPLLYGILDNIDALAEHLDNFEGSGAELDDAWGRLDADTRAQVEAKIRENTKRPAAAAKEDLEEDAEETGSEASEGEESASAPGTDSEVYSERADQRRETAARWRRGAIRDGENASKFRQGAERWRDNADEARKMGQEDNAKSAEESALRAEKNARAADAAAERAEERSQIAERDAQRFDERAREAAEREARDREAEMDIDALAEHLDNFEGSGAELDDAWGRLDADTRARVEAKIRENTKRPAAAAKEDLEKDAEETESESDVSESEATSPEPAAAVEDESSTEELEVTSEDHTSSDSDLPEAEGTSSESDAAGVDESGGAGEGGHAIFIGGGTSEGIPDIEYELYPVDPEEEHWGEVGGGGIAVNVNEGDPTSLNPPGSGGSANSAVQCMTVELSKDGKPITVAAGSTTWIPAIAPDQLARRSVRLEYSVPQPSLRSGSFALATATSAVAHLDVAIRGAVGVAHPVPARAPAKARSSSPQSQLQIFLTNIGSSTGEAFTAQIFNPGSTPVTLTGGSLVVEALKDKGGKKVQKELANLPSMPSLSLDAYCLEFLRLPPVAGTVFRIASSQMQERFAQSRDILSASRELLDAGKLHPDIAPDEYFHSIRQWALWTDEQGFDSASFADAFIQHTRKNLEASGGKWNKQYEKVLRGALGGRWNDIQNILKTAGRG